jgi:uncharacterized membrane protein
MSILLEHLLKFNCIEGNPIMEKYTEYQKRSIAKAVTARVMFTLSHLLNGYIVTGAFFMAANIAGWAAILNMVLFWAHERAWNWAQWNRKPGDSAMFLDGHPRTFSKSATWRALITINNFMIPYIMTGSFGKAMAFLTIATIMNIVLYYVHERVWNRFSLGKVIVAQ